MQHHLRVRELELPEVIRVKNYWLNSSPEHLQRMGIAATELGSKFDPFEEYMQAQLLLDYPEKADYYLVAELNGAAIGHCYVNGIVHRQEAKMHLHIWEDAGRQHGLGSAMVRQSIPIFFDKLALEVLFCEPYALNAAPNKTLKKLGFEFVKRHTTTAAGWNFQLDVNRWQLRKEQLPEIIQF